MTSQGYVMAMSGKKHTMRWPGCDSDEFYIEAVRPDFEGLRDIEQSGLKMGMKTSGKRRDDSVEVEIRLDPEAAFVEKCKTQITGYRFQAKFENEEVKTLTFERQDRDNIRVYQHWAHPENKVPLELFVEDAKPNEMVTLRACIEGFLDMVAGRDTPSAEDYEALGKGQRP
jgi:hypothetical protein